VGGFVPCVEPFFTGTNQIPAYLEFFGYGTTTPEELRKVA
jgi:hypothetical protein